MIPWELSSQECQRRRQANSESSPVPPLTKIQPNKSHFLLCFGFHTSLLPTPGYPTDLPLKIPCFYTSHYQNPLQSRHSQENSKAILAKDITRLSRDIHLLFLKSILSVSTPFLHQTTCGTHILSSPSPVDCSDFPSAFIHIPPVITGPNSSWHSLGLHQAQYFQQSNKIQKQFTEIISRPLYTITNRQKRNFRNNTFH